MSVRIWDRVTCKAKVWDWRYPDKVISVEKGSVGTVIHVSKCLEYNDIILHVRFDNWCMAKLGLSAVILHDQIE
jgi:hypothetical protein